MIKIKFYTKKNCDACKIAKKILGDVIFNLDKEINYNIIPNNEDHINDMLDDNIEHFPTTIILDKNNKEVSRLTGTFTKFELLNELNKLENYIL